MTLAPQQKYEFKSNFKSPIEARITPKVITNIDILASSNRNDFDFSFFLNITSESNKLTSGVHRLNVAYIGIFRPTSDLRAVIE